MKTIPSIPGFSVSSAPTVEPGPITRLKTPAGIPASRNASARTTPVIAPWLAGLKTTVLPVMIAAPLGPAASAIGKLNGAMTANVAERPKDRPGVDGSVAQVVHLVVVEVVLFADVRVVAEQVGGFLDLAEGLQPVLADLERHQGRVLHLSLGDDLRGATKQGQALLQGVARQAGWAARAAAMASWTSCRVPLANVPTRMSRSIGERSSKVPVAVAPRR